MHPLIDLGFITIPTYGLCIMSGVFIAAFLVKLNLFGKRDFDYFILVSACIFAFGFIGARALFVMVTPSISLVEGLTMRGGFVFYGGLIGGVFGYFLGIMLSRIPLTSFMDVYAAVIPFIHAFGRIGCYFAGCCYGFPHQSFLSLPWNKVPGGHEEDVAYFPLQLLEASLLLCISFIVWFTQRKIDFSKKRYIPFLIYTSLYSVLRFVLEFFRGDAYRGVNVALNLSVSQIISISIFVVSLAIIIGSILKSPKKSTVCE